RGRERDRSRRLVRRSCRAPALESNRDRARLDTRCAARHPGRRIPGRRRDLLTRIRYLNLNRRPLAALSQPEAPADRILVSRTTQATAVRVEGARFELAGKLELNGIRSRRRRRL